DRGSRSLGRVLVAERDQIQRAQGPHEPSPEVAVVLGVLYHTCCDERMCNLEQDGGPAAEERGDRRVSEPPDDAFGAEVSVPGGEPLRMRPHARLLPILRPSRRSSSASSRASRSCFRSRASGTSLQEERSVTCSDAS